MMKNARINDKKGVFLAIVAALAMILAGAAVVMASEDVEAVPTEVEELGLFTADSEVDGTPAGYYVNASVTNAHPFTGAVNLYVYAGSDITLSVMPNDTASTHVVNIFVLTSAATKVGETYTVSYEAAETLKFTNTANHTAAAMVITIKASTQSIETTVADAAAGNVYGIMTKIGTKYSWYAPETILSTVTLTADADTVTIKNGTITTITHNLTTEAYVAGSVGAVGVVDAEGVVFSIDTVNTKKYLKATTLADEGTVTLKTGKMVAGTGWVDSGLINGFQINSGDDNTVITLNSADVVAGGKLAVDLVIGGAQTASFEVIANHTIDLGPGASLTGTQKSAISGAAAGTEIFSGTVKAGVTKTTIGYDVSKPTPVTFTNATATNAFSAQITVKGTIVAGSNLIFNDASTIAFVEGGVLAAGANTIEILGTVSGHIATTHITADGDTIKTIKSEMANVQQYTAKEVKEAKAAAINTAALFVTAVQNGYKDITLSGNIELFNLASGVKTLSIDGVTITATTYNITVGSYTDPETYSSFSLEISNSKITATTGVLTVNAKSALDINSSKLFIQVDAKENSTVSVVSTPATLDGASGPVQVGYGSTLYFSGNVTTGASVENWGTIIVPEGKTLSIDTGITVTTYKGSEIQVYGTLNNAGAITIADGAGLYVDGTMTVANANGNAKLTNLGIVAVTGEIAVSAPNEGRPANVISAGVDPTAAKANTNYFAVIGTLKVSGELAGDVRVYGTVVFNGTASTADAPLLHLYDDIDMTITSVKNTVTIKDALLLKEELNNPPAVTVKAGNTLTLTDAKGLTVSTSSSSKVADGKKTITCSMDLSGTVATTGDAFDADALTVTGDNVKVTDSLALAKKTGITNNGKISVSGTMTALQEESVITNNGTITVSGIVSINQAATIAGAGTVNAAYTIVTNTTDASFVATYSALADAMEAIATVDDKTVKLYGANTLKSDIEIDAGETLAFDNSASLTINYGSEVVVNEGGKVNGSGNTITVAGSFAAENYTADVRVKTIVADVVSTLGTARLYTNITDALEAAEPGAEIQTCNTVYLYANTLIKEGVTVVSDYPIVIDWTVALTVNGSLQITKKAQNYLDAKITEVIMTDNLSKYDEETNIPGFVVVNGEVYAVADDMPAVLYTASGAFYSVTVGADTTQAVTSIEIAAENVSENLDDSRIEIHGSVSAGTVTFAKTDKMDYLEIDVVSDIKAARASFTFGTLALDGAVLFVAGDYATVSGTVAAAAADGIATVVLNKAGNLAIESFEVAGAAGSTDYMLISGLIDGDVTVASGTVTVATYNVAASRLAPSALFVAGAHLAVADGATLAVGTNGTLTALYDDNNVEPGAAVDVFGTLDATGGMVNVNGMMNVAGTMNVAESVEGAKYVIIRGVLNVTGTMAVSDDLGKEGIVIINDDIDAVLAVGSKPTSVGATGTVAGTIVIDGAGVVKIYSGTVETIIDSAGNELEGTEITLKGAKYMVIYSEDSTIADIAANEVVEIPGYDEHLRVYVDADMTIPATVEMPGDYAVLYGLSVIETVGIYVSFPSAMEVYIDSVRVNVGNNDGAQYSVGTHTLTFMVKPGYKYADGSTPVVTFAGQTVSGLMVLNITPDMAKLYDEVYLTITADVVVDQPDIPEQEKEDNSMIMILLAVLVIMVVILAIVTVIRMMRS